MKIAEKSRTLNWGPTDGSLPTVTPEQIKSNSISQVINHNKWFVIDGYIIDLSSFTSEHPGGSALLEKYYGRDATKSFDGILQTHTLGARMLVRKMRVAKVTKMPYDRRDSAKTDLNQLAEDNDTSAILSHYSRVPLTLSYCSNNISMNYKKIRHSD